MSGSALNRRALMLGIGSTCALAGPANAARGGHPRLFTILFDWDSVALSAQGREIARQAAAYFLAYPQFVVTVVGHSDTSGPANYNMDLSRRRAEAVRWALTGHGLAAETLAIEARGETDLARATPDEVREPLNRRVQIDYRRRPGL